MRLEDLIGQFAKPDTKITLEEMIQEVKAAYEGHLQAESEKYCCNAKALGEVLGGASRFIGIAESYYAYAIDGVLNTSEAVIQDWLDFSSFINQARWDAEFHATNSLAPGLEKLFKLGAIRARLDIDTLGDAAEAAFPEVLRNTACGYLTLLQIAFLAQMNAKSVRNATQPTAPDRLYTRKEGVRTVVDSQEALRWLKGRRNFKPTSLV